MTSQIPITRQITWYSKKTELVVGELDVNHIPFEQLLAIFHPPPDDPLLYNPYTIRRKHRQPLSAFVSLRFNLRKYIYQLDCFQA